MAGILLAASLGLSVILWISGYPVFFFLLFIPFIPFFRKPHQLKKCPVCRWETAGSERFCPYDGTPLVELNTQD
jgi:hypothetical protein